MNGQVSRSSGISLQAVSPGPDAIPQTIKNEPHLHASLRCTADQNSHEHRVAGCPRIKRILNAFTYQRTAGRIVGVMKNSPESGLILPCGSFNRNASGIESFEACN